MNKATYITLHGTKVKLNTIPDNSNGGNVRQGSIHFSKGFKMNIKNAYVYNFTTCLHTQMKLTFHFIKLRIFSHLFAFFLFFSFEN